MPPVLAAIAAAAPNIVIAAAVAGLSYGLQAALPARPFHIRLSTEMLSPRRPVVRA